MTNQTEELTPRQCLDRHIEKLEEAVDRIESGLDELKEAVDRIESGLDELKDEVEHLRELHPSLPKVMIIEVGEHTWFTDGWRAIRDAWPGEYQRRESEADLGALIPQWEKTKTPVTVTEYAEDQYRELAFLSDGTCVDRIFLRELTAGRGLTIHHDPGFEPVVFRDSAGRMAAIQMPINLPDAGSKVHNRRPA